MGKKIIIDQLIYAPIFTCVLYTYLQIANGDVAGIPEVLQVCCLHSGSTPPCFLGCSFVQRSAACCRDFWVHNSRGQCST